MTRPLADIAPDPLPDPEVMTGLLGLGALVVLALAVVTVTLIRRQRR